MVFKRRDKLPFMQRIRETVLPRTGWSRAFRYIGHRIQRLPDTSHRIAFGLAIGIFLSFSPFFGFHIIFAMVLARYIGGNVFAAFVGTFFGNPLTFPFIAGISFALGRWLTGVSGAGLAPEGVLLAFSNASSGLWQSIRSLFGFGQPEWHRLSGFWHEFFLPYLVGGIIPGILFAIIGYFLSRPLVEAYQKHRRNKLMAKMRKQAAVDRAEG